MQLHVKKKLSIASSQPTGPEIIERRRLTLTHFQLQKTPGLLQILKKKKKKRDKDLTHLQIHTMPGDRHLWGTTEKCCAKMVYLYYLVT